MNAFFIIMGVVWFIHALWVEEKLADIVAALKAKMGGGDDDENAQS